jgi:hypothetical protein
MPSIGGRGRVGLGWGVYLSLPSCLPIRKNSLSVWTPSQVDQGPASSLSLCLSLVRGLVLWMNGTSVCIVGCVCDLYSFCLLLSLLSFSFFGKGVIPSVRHPLWPGQFSPSVSDTVCYGASVRGIIIGSSSSCCLFGAMKLL